MEIKTNNRIILAGKTGSGKTWLAERLTLPIARLVVVDPQDALSAWTIKEPKPKAWSDFAKGDPGRFRVLPPIKGDKMAWYETLFERLYEIGNLTLYIDEAYAVVPPGTRAGEWLQALYSRGRKRGVGVWTATQRPAWIPLFMLSEADWMIQFRLNLEEDRKRMASIAGNSVMGRIPDVHGFWMYDVREELPVYYANATIQKPRTDV